MNVNRIPLIGLLVIQTAIGYEWAMSDLTKIVRGGFPSGLAGLPPVHGAVALWAHGPAVRAERALAVVARNLVGLSAYRH